MRAHWLVGLGISGLVAANCAQGSTFYGNLAGGVGAGDGTLTSTGSSPSGAGGSSPTQATGSTSGVGGSGGGSAGTASTTSASAGGAGAGTSSNGTSTGSAGGSTGTASGGNTTTSTSSSTTSSSSSTSSTTTSSGGALATENEACTSTADCAAGLACAPAVDNGGQQCEKTCSKSSQCTSPGGSCENLVTGKPGTVCTPNCDPMTNAGCLPTEACRIFEVSSTSTSVNTFCGGAGTKGQGKACTDNYQCDVGFACLNGLFEEDCEEVCDVNNDTCPAPYSCTNLGVTLGGTEIGTCE